VSDISITFQGVDDLSGMAQGITGALGGMADVAGGALSVALGGVLKDAFDAVTSAAGDFFKQALDVEGQQARLGALLKSTGDISGMTQAGVNDLALKFRDLAGGSKDAIVSIEEIGLRSGAINANQMPDFIKNVADLGSVMGDTSAAATLLARAQEDPVAALGKLQRAGVLFSDTLKEQIKDLVKHGDTAGATALIMERVAQATGGSAAAAANTLAGRWEILSNHLQDAGKGIAEKLIPPIESLFDQYITPNLPTIEAFAGAFAEQLGPAVAGAVSLFEGLVSTIGDSLTLFKGDLPGALANVLYWLDQFVPGAANVGDAIVGLETTVQGWIAGGLPAIAASLQQWGQAFIAWIAPMVQPLLIEAGKLATQLWTWISTQVPILVNQLIAWGQQLWAWVAPQIAPLLAEAGKLATQLGTWIANQVPVLVGKLLDWATSFVNWVAPQVQPLLDELGKLLGQMTGWMVGTALPAILTQIGAWEDAFWHWVMDPGGAKDQLLPKLSDFLLAVGKFVDTQMIPGFVGFAKSFVQGLMDGLGDKLPDLLGKTEDLANAVIERLKSVIKGKVQSVIDTFVGMVVNAINAAIAAAEAAWKAWTTGHSWSPPSGGNGGSGTSSVTNNRSTTYNTTVNTYSAFNTASQMSMLRGMV